MAGIFLAATDISAITAALHWRRSFGADLHCRLALFGRAAGLRRLFISSIRDIQPRRRNISPIHDIRFFCRSGTSGHVTRPHRFVILDGTVDPGRLAASRTYTGLCYPFIPLGESASGGAVMCVTCYQMCRKTLALAMGI